jgi:hypothetical protein
MKRASYSDACWWIALNDDAGATDALDAEAVSGYVTTALVADLFGIPQERVGLDVVLRRKQNAKAAAPSITFTQRRSTRIGGGGGGEGNDISSYQRTEAIERRTVIAYREGKRGAWRTTNGARIEDAALIERLNAAWRAR